MGNDAWSTRGGLKTMEMLRMLPHEMEGLSKMLEVSLAHLTEAIKENTEVTRQMMEKMQERESIEEEYER